MRKYIYLVTLFAIFAAANTFAQEQKPVAHWGYEGADSPPHWAALDPAFATCQSGQEQSPIDIESAETAELDPIQFHYQDSPANVLDNGHTVMVTLAPGN